ncbi:CFI-box-CTERM domain-containing protein [Capilliphycus salinus ALCB114379]|uniref:CFI-box-CTERM domain-containing protein n=1 Tax=Capilliphycus salinus TaxID=2768948 RepID=UPI0039A56EEE
MSDTSDIEYMLKQNADRAREEVVRLMGRGDFYKERKDYTQALKNYISALEAYAIYAKFKSEVIAVSVAISTQDVNPTNAGIVFSQTLFDLFNLLYLISGFYNSDSIVKVYLESKLVQIAEQLDEYEPVFDEKELSRYGNIKDYAKSVNSNVLKNQEKLSNLQPIKEESNESLKTIRKALSDISSEKICPLSLEERGGCFVATAAYSSSNHPDLDTFRQFRDRTLLTNPTGRLLVSVYYQIGPQLAQFVNGSLPLKKLVRFLLEKLASFMRNYQIWQ